MADEHDLIKIPEFVRKLSPTGQEDIPVADETGTYKVNANALIALVAAAQGYLKQASLNPVINNVSGLLADMPNKIDKSSIVNNLNSTLSTAVLSAAQGRVLKGIIDGFASQVGTGIIGEATPGTEPITAGFGIYTVSTPGVYTNFRDVEGDPIEVLAADLEGGLVQLWGNDNVWDKNITSVDISDPVFNENLSD